MNFYIKDAYDDFHDKKYSKLVIICDQINGIHPLLEISKEGGFELSYDDSKIARENIQLKIGGKLVLANKELLKEQIEETDMMKIAFTYGGKMHPSKVIIRQDLKRMYRSLKENEEKQKDKEPLKIVMAFFIITLLYLLFG